MRYNVTIGEAGNNLLTLTQTGSEEVYSDLDNVGSISVDWVNDRIFWVEHVDSTSQVHIDCYTPKQYSLSGRTTAKKTPEGQISRHCY